MIFVCRRVESSLTNLTYRVSVFWPTYPAALLFIGQHHLVLLWHPLSGSEQPAVSGVFSRRFDSIIGHFVVPHCRLLVRQSDQFQSLVGSVAALCNGGGRLFWGNMLDIFGFKKMFATLALLQVRRRIRCIRRSDVLSSLTYSASKRCSRHSRFCRYDEG